MLNHAGRAPDSFTRVKLPEIRLIHRDLGAAGYLLV